MENFLLAFNVVFPIFLIMMLGVILKRKSIVDEKSLNVMNSLIFRLFMPTLLFFNIYNMGDLSTLSFDNLKLLAYAFSSILIVLFLAWLIYIPKVKDKKKLSVLIAREAGAFNLDDPFPMPTNSSIGKLLEDRSRIEGAQTEAQRKAESEIGVRINNGTSARDLIDEMNDTNSLLSKQRNNNIDSYS